MIDDDSPNNWTTGRKQNALKDYWEHEISRNFTKSGQKTLGKKVIFSGQK
jgi:hypothetical protein